MLARSVPPLKETTLELSPEGPVSSECSLIKVGGSLLTSPDLRQRLAFDLKHLAPHTILMVGGGSLADVVRDWDRIHHLHLDGADSLATMTLRITAALLQQLVPRGKLVTSFAAASEELRNDGVPIIELPAALADPSVEALPKGWEVTSDSMAAVIAIGWKLKELILVKSVDAPHGVSCRSASEQGLVDAYFPKAVRGRIAVRWCNGRLQNWSASSWLSRDAASAVDYS